jgi:hypothetical protein
MLQFQATILMLRQSTLAMAKSRCLGEDWGMKRLLFALAGGIAALALLAGLATTFPLAAIFLRVALESLMPQTIGWEAKNAWAKCDGAIGGTVNWPSKPALACDAMHMCANEADLSAEQRTSLVSAARRLPDCGDP